MVFCLNNDMKLYQFAAERFGGGGGGILKMPMQVLYGRMNLCVVP